MASQLNQVTAHSLNYWSTLFGAPAQEKAPEELNTECYDQQLPMGTPIQNNFEIFTQSEGTEQEGRAKNLF